ncbi:MAG: SDR family oxidoreductase [Pseudomonadota bacterium]
MDDVSTVPNTALVTGAGVRVGRALALALASRGRRVAVHFNRSAEPAEAVVEDIRKAGGEAAAVHADLAAEAGIAQLIDRAADALGDPIGCLVNNASVFEDDGVETMTQASWDLHMAVNLRAPIKLIQDFAGQEGGALSGVAVNIVDQRVLKPTPQFLSYTASKAALYAMTRTLAQALAPRIRVNAIGPGPTLRNKRQSEEDWRKQNAATILGTGSEPEDIAGALLYLLDAKAVTGQMIAVDGGQHLVWQTPDVYGLTE